MITLTDHKLLIDSTTRRWHSLDALLPDVTTVRERGEYDFLAAPDHAGGWLSRTNHLADTDLGSIWREPSTAALVPVVVDSSAHELDKSLQWWRETVGRELVQRLSTAAIYLMLPSRDVWAIPALHRHGFHPHTVVAVRDRRPDLPPSVQYDELKIRTATVGCAEDVISLWHEVIAYDAQIGVCYDRDQTSAMLRRATLDLLARPERAVWVAEWRGDPVGLCMVDLPGYCNAIGCYVKRDDPVYISAFGIRGGQRDKGIGRHLIAHVHAVLAAAGHTTTLLHHAVMNPLCAPFWARSHYRPLWTVWHLSAHKVQYQRMP
ncbi:GNAT family N-acetyltransferase [Nonomuraea glycinis]|uniref:GNAT family N-acetyltransferase n=1 Tax=Nonomuraea glycinis TaxID=2047744 RepID=UPI0033AC5302